MSANHPSPWTPERDDLLEYLWNDGLSSRNIAYRLGEWCTGNAVVGRSYRLGLRRRPNPVKTAKIKDILPPRVPVFCRNPVCLREILPGSGHRDRTYCGPACSTQASKIRNHVLKLSRPSEKEMRKPCLHHRCACYAVPNFHLCYAHAGGEVRA